LSEWLLRAQLVDLFPIFHCKTKTTLVREQYF
jgi:hypothetical protein